MLGAKQPLHISLFVRPYVFSCVRMFVRPIWRLACLAPILSLLIKTLKNIYLYLLEL